MNTDKFYLALPVLMLVIANGTPPAFAWGVNEKSATAFPSKLPSDINPASAEHKLFLGCINGATGEFLDCPFTVDIPSPPPSCEAPSCQPENAPENNGGHTHGDTKNANARPLGQLAYNGPKGEQPVSGNTGNRWAIVTHYLPEFSGKILTRVDLKVPLPTLGWIWRCEDGYGGWRCLDDKTWRILVTTDVRVPRLESLPDGAAAPYIKERGGAANHKNADAYYGLPVANSALTQMAKLFKKSSGEPLSINDMSLPKGGKFDVDGSWSGAHGEHRIGLSADINRRIKADGKKMPCLDNRELQEAVDSVIPATGPRALVNPNAKGRTLSRLYCEPTTYQHIDFDGIPVLSN